MICVAGCALLAQLMRSITEFVQSPWRPASAASAAASASAASAASSATKKLFYYWSDFAQISCIGALRSYLSTIFRSTYASISGSCTVTLASVRRPSVVRPSSTIFFLHL